MGSSYTRSGAPSAAPGAPWPDAGTPALRRGLAILRALAAAPDGLSVAEIAHTVDAPRATLYRLLHTLVLEGFARPAPKTRGRYVATEVLSRLAGRGDGHDLVAIARPTMDALVATLDETVKLVVRDGLEALTLAVSLPARDSCIASRSGARLPLHVGGSQRLLLAHAPRDIRERVLAGPLRRVTARTIVSRRRLQAELDDLAVRRDVASHGEGVDGVGATTALVGRAGEEPRAALVVVYVYASQSSRKLAEIRRATRRAADRITEGLG